MPLPPSTQQLELEWPATTPWLDLSVTISCRRENGAKLSGRFTSSRHLASPVAVALRQRLTFCCGPWSRRFCFSVRVARHASMEAYAEIFFLEAPCKL